MGIVGRIGDRMLSMFVPKVAASAQLCDLRCEPCAAPNQGRNCWWCGNRHTGICTSCNQFC